MLSKNTDLTNKKLFTKAIGAWASNPVTSISLLNPISEFPAFLISIEQFSSAGKLRPNGSIFVVKEQLINTDATYKIDLTAGNFTISVAYIDDTHIRVSGNNLDPNGARGCIYGIK